MFRNHKLSKKQKAKCRTNRHVINAVTSIFVATLGMSQVPQIASAQSVTQVEFDGGKSRVNLSGRLRTLNQAMSGAACQIGAGIDVETARARLFEARTAFGSIIRALREGDIAIGVPTVERRARILSKIWEIEQEWVKVKFAADKILGGIRIPEYVDVISQKTDKQHQVLNDLLSEIVAHYSNPAEMLTGDAFRINVAGRQRTLSEKMAKEICGIASKQPVFGKVSDIEQTFALFEKSLTALEFGLPSAGIAPPPNEFVTGKLIEVRIKWLHARYKAIETAKDTNDLERKNRQFVALRKEMNNVVTLYMTSTLGQKQAYQAPLAKFGKEILSKWALDEKVLNAVVAQNTANKDITQAEIFELDRRWRSEVNTGGDRPLIDEMYSRDLSNWLFVNQVESSGLITEVFVTDNKGLNVGVSSATSDIWQGDEPKWTEPFYKNNIEPFITDVVFDQSTGFFQSHLSLPVRDPQTGAAIGAITFGINVQAFL